MLTIKIWKSTRPPGTSEVRILKGYELSPERGQLTITSELPFAPCHAFSVLRPGKSLYMEVSEPTTPNNSILSVSTYIAIIRSIEAWNSGRYSWILSFDFEHLATIPPTKAMNFRLFQKMLAKLKEETM